MATGWLEETIYREGDAYFADLLATIRSAKLTVELESYIFDRDSLGERVLEEMRQAAKRGVAIRLLLDGVGCHQWSHAEASLLESEGVHIRFFHPLPWQNRNYRFWKFLTVQKIFLGFRKLNRRNHRKTCSIDGEVTFAGGMNVSARHLQSVEGDLAWRDTAARVRGVGIQVIQKLFDRAWNSHLGVKPLSGELSGDTRSRAARGWIRTNASLSQRELNYRNLIRRFRNAQTRIWITNPYFIPHPMLIRALKFAAGRGVDVRLLLPQRLDIRGMRWAIRAFYQVLLSGKVRIFEYLPTMLHAKTLMIDDWVTVGSSNLNYRSLFFDLELDLVLGSRKSVYDLELQFLQDLARSEEVKPHRWANRIWVERILEKFAVLFRHWI